jgi:hypothetical protein
MRITAMPSRRSECMDNPATVIGDHRKQQAVFAQWRQL